MALFLLAGCGTKSSVVGTWKDTSLDQLTTLSAEDKDRMRAILTFNADGTATFQTGGSRVAASIQTPSQTIPVKWKQDGSKVMLDGAGPGQEFIVSVDGRTMTLNGNSVPKFQKQ